MKERLRLSKTHLFIFLLQRRGKSFREGAKPPLLLTLPLPHIRKEMQKWEFKRGNSPSNEEFKRGEAPLKRFLPPSPW